MGDPGLNPVGEEEAKKFAEEQEKSKIYDRPQDDPVFLQFQEAITKQTNLDVQEAQQGNMGTGAKDEADKNYRDYWFRQNMRIGMQQWDNFVSQYPEKAEAYQTADEAIKRALDRQQKSAPEATTAVDEVESTDTENKEKSKENIDPELAREIVKTKGLEEKYAILSPEQRQNFVASQKEAGQIVTQAIKGERQIGDLSPEEQAIINKAQDIYKREQEKNPGSPLTIQFAREVDGTVYSNLVNRLTFILIAEKSALGDQTRANEIRNSIGVSEKPVDTSNLTLVEGENTNQDTVDSQQTEQLVDNPLEKYIKSAKEGFDQQVAQIEAQQGQTLSMREKLSLLSERFAGNDFYFQKVRESLLKPEDYVDISNVSGNPDQKITWYDFDEDDTGDNIYVYRGLSGRTEGQEHLSARASDGQSEDDIISSLGADKFAIMKQSSEITGAFGADPVLHTTRSKDLAIGFSSNKENGAVITYMIPKKWITEHKDDVALAHQEEKEIDFFYGLPKNFIDKIEKTSELP